MQQPQQRPQHVRKAPLRGLDLFPWRVRVVQDGLGHLQVPVAELVPGEFVQRLGGQIEAVLGKRPLNPLDQGAQPRSYPAVRGGVLQRLIRKRGLHMKKYVRGGVPELVAEVAAARNPAHVQADVAPGGRKRREGEAKRVRTVGRDPVGELLARARLDAFLQVRLHHAFGSLADQRFKVHAVDDEEGIEDIALGLGHLLPGLVSHEPMDVDIRERHVTHELQSHHDHPRHPEEDDVESGDQDPGRIEALKFLRARGPVHRGKRP